MPSIMVFTLEDGVTFISFEHPGVYDISGLVGNFIDPGDGSTSLDQIDGGDGAVPPTDIFDGGTT